MPPLYLDEAERVTVPPVGRRLYFIDADGLMKEVKSDGSKANVGGGGVGVGACGSWAAAQAAFINGLMPTLTGYQHLKAAQQPLGGAVPSTNDGAVEGGGRTGANGAMTFLSGSVFQIPKTGRGAFAFRAKFGAVSGAQTSSVGLSNAAGSHDFLIGMVGSTSTVNFSMTLDGAVSTNDVTTVANDLGWHTFVVTFDATNVKLYIDGTLRATRAITTNVVDEPTYLATFNSVSGGAIWEQCLYAYVAP
jgi:hypothetical protein